MNKKKDKKNILKGFWWFLGGVFIFSVFLFVSASVSFPDPDAFYHIKIASKLSQNNLAKIEFSSLPYTTLESNFTDHHFLYHLALVPFAKIFGNLMGVKIATAFFISLVLIVLLIILRKINKRNGFLIFLIAISSTHFLHRMNLAKTSSLSVLFLIIFIWLVWQKKSWIYFFILSFSYVWLYGGWPIMLGLSIFYFLAELIHAWLEKKTGAKKIKQTESIKFSIKLIFVIFIGALIGLVAHPYFPENINFYIDQTIKIGFLNGGEKINFGNEWLPYGPLALVWDNFFVILLFLGSAIYFAKNYKKQKGLSWWMLITSFFFFIMTLKAKRNIEYFVPMASIFAVSTLPQIPKIGFISYKKIKKYINKKENEVNIFLIISFVVLYLAMTLSQWSGFIKMSRGGFEFDRFVEITDWLEKNTQKNDIVFNDDWSVWPILFYHNDYNRYIAGLDPRFLLYADKEKYREWEKLRSGAKKNTCQRIKDVFDAHYLIIGADNNNLFDSIKNNNSCEMIMRNKDGYLFRIK